MAGGRLLRMILTHHTEYRDVVGHAVDAALPDVLVVVIVIRHLGVRRGVSRFVPNEIPAATHLVIDPPLGIPGGQDRRDGAIAPSPLPCGVLTRQTADFYLLVEYVTVVSIFVADLCCLT